MDAKETRVVDRTDFLHIILEGEDQQVLPLLVTGGSMMPFLLDRRSLVYLKKDSTYRPRRGDIVMFMRLDGMWVLHRITRLLPDGRLLINGDAQRWTEIILPDQIAAHVVRIRRRKREFSAKHPFYRFLVWLWMPLRLLHPLGGRLCYIWHRLPYKLFPRYMSKKEASKQS